MTQSVQPMHMSVSLGSSAMTEVREAVRHACANLRHDPVIFLVVDDLGQRVSWRCVTCDGSTVESDPRRFVTLSPEALTVEAELRPNRHESRSETDEGIDHE